MAILTNAIGSDVIKALGLPMKGVTGIKLDMQAGEIVKVDVSYYPEREQIAELIKVVGRYELVEREFTPGWRDRIDLMADEAQKHIESMAAAALERYALHIPYSWIGGSLDAQRFTYWMAQ